MKKPIAAVYGAGGQARVVGSILRATNLEILGYFDDAYKENEVIQGSPLLGPFAEILEYRTSFTDVYIAIGDNAKRKSAYVFLKGHEVRLPRLIHPSVIREKDASIGEGSTICMGSILGAETEIGAAAIVNTGCSVDHESKVGDYSHLAPGVIVAGRTRIGNHVFVGMNSTIADKLVIGDNVTIGAGSVVLRDVSDGEKLTGVYH